MRSTGIRSLVPVMAAAMVFTASAGTTVTATDVDEGSLCDALSLDELHALGPLRYAEPEFGGPAFCVYEASPDQQGPHSLNLTYREIPFGVAFDDFREGVREQSPGIVDITVGGQPGYADETIPGSPGVLVGIDDSFLAINPNVEASAEGQGVDSIDYAISVAEIVVSRLAESLAAERATAMPPPPPVDGVEWTRITESIGAEIISNDDVGFADLLTRLLEETGADLEQATLLSATARPENASDAGGLYLALRINRVEGSRLVPGLLAWLTTATGDRDLSATPTTLGGKEVTEVSVDGETTGFAYGAGDTLYLLSFPAELATKVLAELS